MTYPRVAQLNEGAAMIVTDLHGDGDAYDQIRRKFMELHDSGRAAALVICGDLIHGYADEDTDASLRMILDVMRLQDELGEDTVIMLMGNHEMPHVYNIALSKGNREFTARFERALTDSGKRSDVYAFLYALPFYVWTKAGALISHAGATPAIQSVDKAEDALTVDHRALLQLADDIIGNSGNYDSEQLKADKSYMQQAAHYLALEDNNDPRFKDLLRGQVISQTQPEFDFLWDILFARNEHGHGQGGYEQITRQFLQVMSQLSPYEQRIVVAGHIGTQGGYKIVNDQHLRLSTHAHAHPLTAGQYLLLDCEIPVTTAHDLVPHLHDVFPQE